MRFDRELLRDTTLTGTPTEFGTLPDLDVLDHLRADHWLHRHPEAPESQRRAIRQGVRDAFYCDDDLWKGMILGQARVVLLQTIEGLRHA